MSEMPIEYHLGAADLETAHAIAVVRPGDTVIVNCPEQIPQDQAAAVKAHAEAVLPEGVKVLVIVGGSVTIARGPERDGTLEGEPS